MPQPALFGQAPLTALVRSLVLSGVSALIGAVGGAVLAWLACQAGLAASATAQPAITALEWNSGIDR